MNKANQTENLIWCFELKLTSNDCICFEISIFNLLKYSKEAEEKETFDTEFS